MTIIGGSIMPVNDTSNERARRILPKIVEIIHELGAQVVCEGIKTTD